jgi:hypothetical protein
MRHLLDVSAARKNLEGLPAVTAIAAISAASTTTAMAAASTSAAATSTSISAAAAPAAATTLSLRSRFVYHQVSPAEILSVKRVYGLVGVFVVGDFDEGEAA